MFMTLTLVSCHFVTLIIVSSPLQSYQLPLKSSGKKTGRKLVRAISAESIYHCVLLFLDHILYRRAHFVRNALCASRAVLAITVKKTGFDISCNAIGDKLHEMSKPLFWEKSEKCISMSSAENFTQSAKRLHVKSF